MAGKLTTHVLDTARGRPAAGMRVELFRVVSNGVIQLEKTVTNVDGRTPSALLFGEGMKPATYRLLFFVGEYFVGSAAPDAGRFLDVVPVQFNIDDPTANYHVPLLVSPWAYSTYRGS